MELLHYIPRVVLMSEKRFVIDEEGISDNKTDKWYCWKEEVVDLLNKQQATIDNQEQKIKILQQEIKDTQAILEMQSEKLKGWNDE